jgi:hypothetical protein
MARAASVSAYHPTQTSGTAVPDHNLAAYPAIAWKENSRDYSIMNIEHSNFHSVGLVAEVKIQSPFGFKSKRSWDQLFEIAIEYGDVVSIHVSPEWAGSTKLIEKAYPKCAEKGIPILAKGIRIDDTLAHECLKCGANFFLSHDQYMHDYFEPGTVWQELPPIKQNDTFMGMKLCRDRVYVVNARNIASGEDAPDHWDYIRRLHPWVSPITTYGFGDKSGGVLVQASKIKTIKDIKPDANMVIVGEHLPEFIKDLNECT